MLYHADSWELNVMTNSVFLLQWQRSMQRVSLRSGMGNLGNVHPHLRLSLEDVSHHFAGNSHHL